MTVDPLVISRYENHYDEDQRLRKPGLGDLVRLRTWELFARFLPAGGSVADVGGGTGTHAAHLVRAGHEVVLIDPVPRHVRVASAKGVTAVQGDARVLPLPDDSVDAVLMMGPLYHLLDPADRQAALGEARRVLRPGGTILAEIITRTAWMMEATYRGMLGDDEVWDEFDAIARTGVAKSSFQDGDFPAYFHRPDELRDELTSAGLDAVQLASVEGFAHLLPELDRRMREEPGAILRVVRLTESDPSMLGAGQHVIGIAAKPVAQGA